MREGLTREKVQALIPEVMAEAFEKGRQDALACKPKYHSNPYGGLPSECGTGQYPARVPLEHRQYSGWIRNEWFWGYEDVIPGE